MRAVDLESATIAAIFSALNDGLPRAAWPVIGDRTQPMHTRIAAANTLVVVQTALGAALAMAIFVCAPLFATLFVPAAVRLDALPYVRVSSLIALTSVVDVAITNTTRALDSPNVPLAISSLRCVLNIAADFALLSRWRLPFAASPTVLTQALTRLACDVAASSAAIAFYLHSTRRARLEEAKKTALKLIDGAEQNSSSRPPLNVTPNWRALRALASPARWTFAESSLRNFVYLWLMKQIISISADYATGESGVLSVRRQRAEGVFQLGASSLRFDSASR